MKKTTATPGRTRYLIDDEYTLLLNGRDEILTAQDGRRWRVHRGPSDRLKIYIVAALQTGARRGELLDLLWEDVDLQARTITFPKTKNGDARSIPITDTLYRLLLSLPRPLDPKAHVFPRWSPEALTNAFGHLARRLGLKDLRFHDLRHDAASTLTMAGVPQRSVMAILGHRDPRMTIRYQHLSPEYLREAAVALDTRHTRVRVTPLRHTRACDRKTLGSSN